jgi:hypothetical protein
MVFTEIKLYFWVIIMAAASRSKTRTSKQFSNFRIDVFLLELLSKVGVLGTFVIVILYVFLNYSTVAQKQEFIDDFILLKILENDVQYGYFAALFSVFAYIMTLQHFLRHLQIKDLRINYLETALNQYEQIKRASHQK